MEPDSFCTPKEEEDEQILEANMVHSLQIIGARVRDLGSVFTGGDRDLKPEDLARLTDEKATLRPVIDTLKPLMTETGQVAGHLVRLMDQVAEGRKKILMLVVTVDEGDDDALLMSFAKKSVEAWQTQKPTFPEVHELLSELCIQWGKPEWATQTAKDKMSARVQEMEQTHREHNQQTRAPSMGPATCCAFVILCIGASIIAWKFSKGHQDIVGYASAILLIIGGLVQQTVWPLGVEKGLSAAAHELRQAIQLEGEVKQVLEHQKIVKAELEKLRDAVHQLTQQGTQAQNEASRELKEDSGSYRERFAEVLNLAAEGTKKMEWVIQWLVVMKKDRPEKFSILEAALSASQKRARHLSEQLELWKARCGDVEGSMGRLQDLVFP